MRGDTREHLIGLLERRLDAVVYRAKFVPTIFAARQFVNHGHVAVNGKRVNIASYLVKEGDVVQRARQVAADGAGARGDGQPGARRAGIPGGRPFQDDSRVRARPGLTDVPYPVMMEPNLVVEYYAKN